MQEDYEDLIEKIGKEIAEAILDKEKDLAKRARLIDKDVAEILRKAGQAAMILIFAVVGGQLVDEAKASGLTVQARPVITYNVIFGPIEVESPYLWKNGQSSKPVKDQMGLTQEGRSETVERALADFGIEDSFKHAAKRFEEHYGWPVDKSTARRVTETVAAQAEEYLNERLEKERKAYDIPIEERPGVDRLVAELDACKVRTGVLAPAEEASRVTDETSRDKEQPQKRTRVINFRDVRMGLVTDLDGQDKDYVGRVDTYPVVVNQLFSIAVKQGLSSKTQVITVADGGNGIREELERQFPHVLFILDQPHLKDHLYKAAEAMGLETDERKKWVKEKRELIETGRAKDALDQLRDEYAKSSVDDIRKLVGYLDKYKDATDYQQFKAEGLPIGDGEIESTHRYIPQKRLNVPGACWHPDNVNPMLSLRVLRADDWWDDFWENRSSRIAA